MYFPLFLPLWAETREIFCLGFPDHLIKQSCGSSFRFPFRVSVDVHCGTYVSVSKQFLHILWCYTIGEQITGECVSQHMKMEIFKSFQLLFCRPCHNTNCTRWLVCSVRSQADKGYFLVPVGTSSVLGMLWQPALRSYIDKFDWKPMARIMFWNISL